jgi:hypothetical protein
MSTPSFLQAVAISYETMTFSEVMQLPSVQRIAMNRIRAQIKKEIDRQMEEAKKGK